VFRYGGEEFCVLMPDTSLEDAVKRMDRMREQVASSEYEWDGQTFGVTISIGVASSADYPHSLELFESADKALYGAKQHGRNRVSRLDKEALVLFAE
jgi:diguanylate cyclase (GGDEF)-like protein